MPQRQGFAEGVPEASPRKEGSALTQLNASGTCWWPDASAHSRGEDTAGLPPPAWGLRAAGPPCASPSREGPAALTCSLWGFDDEWDARPRERSWGLAAMASACTQSAPGLHSPLTEALEPGQPCQPQGHQSCGTANNGHPSASLSWGPGPARRDPGRSLPPASLKGPQVWRAPQTALLLQTSQRGCWPPQAPAPHAGVLSHGDPHARPLSP